MKRMNVLLSKRMLTETLAVILIFPVALSLFAYFLCGMFGENTDGLFPLGVTIFFILALFILFVCTRRLPLYLEYDNEKIIAYYIFRKPVTVRKDQTIYRAYVQYAKHDYHTVLSNTPFRVTETPSGKWVVRRVDRKTQIILPEQDMAFSPCVYFKSACTPAERVKWDELIERYETEKATYADSERIFILPGYLWTLLGIECGVIAFLFFLFFIFSEGFTYAFVMLLQSAILWAFGLYEIIKAYKNRRFCGTVSFGENAVTSKLFKREQCTVDLTQTVHYAVFRGAEYGSKGKPYIVISNEWFNYYPIIDSDRSYLSVYDAATQIVFPYNAETAPICDFDNWHCVGGFGELNMKRSKT